MSAMLITVASLLQDALHRCFKMLIASFSMPAFLFRIIRLQF